MDGWTQRGGNNKHSAVTVAAAATAVAATTTTTAPDKAMTAVYYYANIVYTVYTLIWLSRYECVVTRLVRGIVCILFHLLANGNSI